ncbi:hypothetical protein BB559_003939 [Furculomyces boomerangus]|uniref:Uncharacterized protein n=1 Tax=Furculomyces boomerangus TaxID=61424 RepID=A0A2T9YHT8_9FUNG|nr:hypothetical protein BB559_003939 [Furculomyces boomerangus]
MESEKTFPNKGKNKEQQSTTSNISQKNPTNPNNTDSQTSKGSSFGKKLIESTSTLLSNLSSIDGSQTNELGLLLDNNKQASSSTNNGNSQSEKDVFIPSTKNDSINHNSSIDHTLPQKSFRREFRKTVNQQQQKAEDINPISSANSAENLLSLNINPGQEVSEQINQQITHQEGYKSHINYSSDVKDTEMRDGLDVFSNILNGYNTKMPNILYMDSKRNIESEYSGDYLSSRDIVHDFSLGTNNDLPKMTNHGPGLQENGLVNNQLDDIMDPVLYLQTRKTYTDDVYGNRGMSSRTRKRGNSDGTEDEGDIWTAHANSVIEEELAMSEAWSQAWAETSKASTSASSGKIKSKM